MGYHLGCSLFSGGKVVCWGENGFGQLGRGTTTQNTTPTLVSGIANATSVAAGFYHVCAVLSDGTVKCWGQNANGQLGNGLTTPSSVPVTVSGITNATMVTAGAWHTCARLTDSTVKCWGANNEGQAGTGTFGNQYTTPVAVTGLSNVTAVRAGATHTCSLDSSGNVKCWGRNTEGEIGDNTTVRKTSPTTISGAAGASAIASYYYSTCAVIASSSAVKCWGYNAYGGLGDGTTTQRNSPVAVSGLTGAVDVTMGWAHSCAKLSNGTAKCWGRNDYGQLGNGTTTLSKTPVAVSTLSSIVELAAGGDEACASVTGGGFRCWGMNDGGELARGLAGFEATPVVRDYTAVNKVITSASGSNFTCVIWDAGSVKCWGANAFGQLGNGTTTPSQTPVVVSGITNAVELKAGSFHVCARLADNTVKCWGLGLNGQLGNNAKLNSSVPVTASGITNAISLGVGGKHSCVVLSGGTAKCWGRGNSNEIGDGGLTDRAVPTTVSSLTGATAIIAGGFVDTGGTDYGHSCALISGGTAKCWGNNGYGQCGTNQNSIFAGLPLPANTATAVYQLTGATQLTSNGAHTCALLSTGAMKCWGANTNGQLGNGATSTKANNAPVNVSSITNAVEASVGYLHSCARFSDKTVKCWGYNHDGNVGNGATALGPNYTDNVTAPVTVVGVKRATGLSAGDSTTCTRNDDATLTCWGRNTVVGGTSGQANPTPTSPSCWAPDVERSDYFVDFSTANMPDSNLNGLSESLDMHRVKPVFFPSSCTAQKAIVLTHGRTVEAVSAFDLQYQDYSVMEQLARSGIDAVTFNQLGMGRSKLLSNDPLTNACNASLPACLDIGQTCPPPNGVLCDCGPAATFGVNDKNQQGSTRYLNPNPLSALCAHTTNTRFTSSTTMDADIDAAINDTLAKTNLSKVSLLGYSAGGPIVGNYLSVADDTLRAARSAKVERAIFVASLFGAPPGTTPPVIPPVPDTEPTGGSNAHSFPMGVMDRTSATAGGFNLDVVACPGQRDDNIVDPIWQSVKARDAVASGWGPSQSPAQNAGLSRFPHATRWGWNYNSAPRVSVPVLVMQGLRDNVVSVGASSALYAALTGTSSKTIVQVGCGSHSIFWEGCSGANCNGWTGPHFTLFKNARDWINTGMIYASPGSENGAFESTANDGTNAHTAGPTSDGPAADESNQLP
jgi:alpha-tubulin suppressor-like RCC1 family protein/pimeloyl-ACP methyl ester carboxylesterase